MSKLINNLIKPLFKKPPDWSRLSDFKSGWSDRSRLLGELTKGFKSVADFGCGPMELKKHLMANQQYYPIDKFKRGDDTIIFNAELDVIPDCVPCDNCAFVLSGIIEYIKNYSDFFNKINKHSPSALLISYVPMDRRSCKRERKSMGWINNLYTSDLLMAFIERYNVDHFSWHNDNAIVRMKQK